MDGRLVLAWILAVWPFDNALHKLQVVWILQEKKALLLIDHLEEHHWEKQQVIWDQRQTSSMWLLPDCIDNWLSKMDLGG